VIEVNDALTRWLKSLTATQQLMLRGVLRGWTRAEVASRLGVDERTIRCWLDGVPPPPPEANAARILAFLAEAAESAA
jgi:hypothetical protein